MTFIWPLRQSQNKGQFSTFQKSQLFKICLCISRKQLLPEYLETNMKIIRIYVSIVLNFHLGGLRTLNFFQKKCVFCNYTIVEYSTIIYVKLYLWMYPFVNLNISKRNIAKNSEVQIRRHFPEGIVNFNTNVVLHIFYRVVNKTLNLRTRYIQLEI